MAGASLVFQNSAAKVVQKKEAANNCDSFATDATILLLSCYCCATRYSISENLHTEKAA